MNRFRQGLVFKAHRLVYHSTLGLRVIKKQRSLTYERLQDLREKVQDDSTDDEKQEMFSFAFSRVVQVLLNESSMNSMRRWTERSC